MTMRLKKIIEELKGECATMLLSAPGGQNAGEQEKLLQHALATDKLDFCYDVLVTAYKNSWSVRNISKLVERFSEVGGSEKDWAAVLAIKLIATYEIAPSDASYLLKLIRG